MNKSIARITYYSCFVLALAIPYYALNHAVNLAYSGEQPLLLVNFMAFVIALLLILLAIFIKVKYKV